MSSIASRDSIGIGTIGASGKLGEVETSGTEEKVWKKWKRGRPFLDSLPHGINGCGSIHRLRFGSNGQENIMEQSGLDILKESVALSYETSASAFLRAAIDMRVALACSQ